MINYKCNKCLSFIEHPEDISERICQKCNEVIEVSPQRYFYRCLSCGLQVSTLNSFNPSQCSGCDNKTRFARSGSTSEFYCWLNREDVCAVRDHISTDIKTYREKIPGTNFVRIIKVCSGCYSEFSGERSWDLHTKE